MKKLSFIVAFIAMFLNANVMRADVYSDGINQLLNDQVMASPLQGKLPSNVEEKKFIGIVSDWMSDSFRQNMSEAEFKQMMEFYKQPKILEASKKIVSISLGNLDDPYLQELLRPNIMKIIKGENAEDLKAPECSADYLASFEKYWKLSDCEEAMKSAFSSVTQMMNSQAGQDAGKMAFMKNAMDYICRNSKNLVLTVFQRSIDKEDLDTFNSIGDQSFYPSYMKAEKALISGIPDIMKKFSECVK